MLEDVESPQMACIFIVLHVSTAKHSQCVSHMSFLGAEWGDRSQIATVSLAAVYNPVGVTVGAVVGHMLCTGTAVVGGQLLAMRISQRTVAIAGGLLFLAFALNSVITNTA